MEKNSIIEKIMLRIDVELPQLTHEKAYGCKMMGLESIDKTTIKIKCGKECTSDKCNFLCKWFAQKKLLFIFGIGIFTRIFRIASR